MSFVWCHCGLWWPLRLRHLRSLSCGTMVHSLQVPVGFLLFLLLPLCGCFGCLRPLAGLWLCLWRHLHLRIVFWFGCGFLFFCFFPFFLFLFFPVVVVVFLLFLWALNFVVFGLLVGSWRFLLIGLRLLSSLRFCLLVLGTGLLSLGFALGLQWAKPHLFPFLQYPLA